MLRLPPDIQDTFNKYRSVINSRLNDFKQIAGDNIFYEFCFCILTPQSSAANAWAVQRKLVQQNFLQEAFNPTPLLANKEHYIRFHNTKAKRLLTAIDYYPKLQRILACNNSAADIRKQIKTDFVGIGMKEASHFLRNIGYNNLAIIDRHILRNLAACGVLTSPQPPKTDTQYIAIEQQMIAFANEIRIEMDVLDLLFFAHSAGQVLK